MSLRKAKEVQPRNGLMLNVGIVARISGCPNQKDLSLEDQEARLQSARGDLESRRDRARGAVGGRHEGKGSGGEIEHRPMRA